MDATESPFLRELLAHPGDQDARRRYAEWLDARGESRKAEYLRLDPAASRLDCVPWLESDSDGDLSQYLKYFRALRPIVEAYRERGPARERAGALAREVDPGWAALVASLGCPFEPFGFFDNTKAPAACKPEELPFAEPIGTRGPVVSFASDFREPGDDFGGLAKDLRFLATLELGDCYYGSTRCPVHPFIGRLDARSDRPSREEILAALRASQFDAFADGDSFRDQIHRDFLEQHIFPHPAEEVFEVLGDDEAGSNPELDMLRDMIRQDYPDQQGSPPSAGDVIEMDDDDEDDEDELYRDVDETTGVHGALREYVGGDLWYVLLHTRPAAHEPGGPAFPEYVVLFAVGRSPHGDRLVGVVTHQCCHNLCD